MAKKKNTTAKKQTKQDSNSLVGLWIPAGIFVGLGLGMLYNKTAEGLFIGLGAGFILMALTRMIRK